MRNATLHIALDWRKPESVLVYLWTSSYLMGTVDIPVANPPQAQPLPRWSQPLTIGGQSNLLIPRYFDRTIELFQAGKGIQVYRYEDFILRPLYRLGQGSLSGTIAWLDKELDRLEEFLVRFPLEVVRVWNREVRSKPSWLQASLEQAARNQDREYLLGLLPYFLPIELELEGDRIVLLFRGQEFPEGEDPVAFALDLAPEIALWMA